MSSSSVSLIVVSSGLCISLLSGCTLKFNADFHPTGIRSVGASNTGGSVTAAELVFSQTPSSTAIAGVTLATQPSISVQDGLGNIATSYTAPITLDAYTDPACTTTVALGTLAGASLSPSSGIASGSTVSYTKAETIYLKATSGTLNSACSSAVNVSPAGFSRSQSTLTASALTVASGSSITVTLTAMDAFGNGNPTGISSETFTASPMGGDGTLGSISPLGGGIYQTSFTGTVAGVVTLGGTLNLGALTSSSPSVTVQPGTATQLVFTTNPSPSATAGATLGTQPVVTVEDSNSNTVSLYSTAITLSAFTDAACSTTVATGTLGGNTLTPSSGVASGSNVSYSKAETIYLKATSGSLISACSPAIVVSAGATTQLSFSAIATPQVASTTFSVTVSSLDALGNTATGYLGTVTLTSTDTIATLPTAHTFTSTDAGAYTFTGIQLNSVGSWTLTASDGGVSKTSGSITINCGGSTGQLDSSLGGTGYLTFNPGSFPSQGSGAALQANGNIVVAGMTAMTSSSAGHMGLARFKPDGSADSSFTGATTNYVIPGATSMYSIKGPEIQADGKIVTVGAFKGGSYQYWFALRSNADGSLDSGFNSNTGYYAFWSLPSSYGYTLLIDPVTQAILTGGIFTVGSHFYTAAIRLGTDGTIDSTFGNNTGVSSYLFSSNYDVVQGLARQSDGSLIIGGYQLNGGINRFYATRLLASGSWTQDTAFNGTGLWYDTTAAAGLSDSANGNSAMITTQSNDKILLTGYRGGTSNSIITTRLNSDGTLDTGFGSSGRFSYSASGTPSSAGSVVQSDGKIVVAGHYLIGSGKYGAVLYRLNTDGTIDTSFGTSGYVVNPFSSATDAAVTNIKLQPDGRIVISGRLNTSGTGVLNGNMMVARFCQ